MNTLIASGAYCELVYVDRRAGLSGGVQSLLVQSWHYQGWVGCYCKL